MDNEKLKLEIKKCIEVLENGGVILYPTDTVWGLGGDATNESAAARINAIKGRSEDKSFIVLLDTDVKLASYVNDIPEVAYDLIEYADSPLTIIFSGAKNLAKNVINQDGSIGIRIANHEFCRQLIQRYKRPITSSSANQSGQPTPRFFEEITQEIKDAADYVVNWEQDLNIPRKPSTIVKLGSGGQFSFIRR